MNDTGRFDRLLDSIYPHLNAIHGVERSRRFWGILVYRYLDKVLFFARAGVPSREPPANIPTEDAMFGPRVGELAAAPPRSPEPRSTARFANIRRRLAGLPRTPAAVPEWLTLRRVWRTPADTAKSIMVGFHHYHVLPKYLRAPVASLALDPSFTPQRDGGRRSALLEVVRGDAVARDPDASLVRMALEWMPIPYVEEFQSRDVAVRLVAPEDKRFHAAFLSPFQARYHVARYVEEGAKLDFYQHSAPYGEVRDFVLHHAESQLSERFFTWGWQQKPNDVPFLALRLMRPAGQRIQRKPEPNRWVYEIVEQPLPWLIDTTLDVQDRFFATLDAKRASRISLRPRTNKGGSIDAQITDRARRAVGAVDSGAASWERMAGGAELLILDSFPATGFMECLTIGLPVVAIVPPTTDFTDLARKSYEPFFDAGVLHHTPESAAAFLNDLDVGTWWRSVESRDWFREYMHTFCRLELGRGEIPV